MARAPPPSLKSSAMKIASRSPALRRRAPCLTVAALSASLWMAGCGQSRSGEPAAASAPVPQVVREGGRIKVALSSPLRKALLVGVAEEQLVERPIAVPAVIEADPAKLVKVVPPVSGRIV